MSDLVEVTYTDGSSEIVTVEEAVEYRKDKLLAEPESDNKGLTLEDVYGDDFD